MSLPVGHVLEETVMVEGKPVYGELIQGFAGEQRTVAENLLPGNVSPDGLNIDYRDGTVRKRRGVSRLGVRGVIAGGVSVNYQISGSDEGRYCKSTANVVLTENLQTYNFLVFRENRGGARVGDMRVFLHETAAGLGTGLWLTTANEWEARLEHTSGTLTARLATTSGTVFESPSRVQLEVDLVAKVLTLTVNGVSDTGGWGAQTLVQPAGRVYLGGADGTEYGMNFIIGDFRIWDGAVGALLASPAYPLSTAEQTAALAVWWRFLSLSGQDFPDSSGNAISIRRYGPELGLSAGWTHDVDAYWDIEAMVAVPSTVYQGLVAGTRGAIYYQAQGTTNVNLLAVMGSESVVSPSRRYRMQFLRYRDRDYSLNGVGENLKGSLQASYAAPAMSGPITITAAGSGGSINAGVHSYLFSISDASEGVESAVGAEISTQTAAANDEFTLDFTTGGFMLNRYYAGADTIRIYRTKAGGTVYYHLADIAITATSYVDDAADSTLVTARPLYTGYAAPSRFGFELNGSLWLGNQAGSENTLVYTEPGTRAEFYSDNYLDLEDGDSDVLTGGIAVGGRAVVFKRRSAWIVSGAGSSVSAEKLFPGVGCVQHATIAASHNALYWLGEGGVYTMALPSGAGAPQSLTLAGWRDYFGGMTEEDYENCSAIWDAVNERYILSVTIAGVRQTLVYCAARQAWALWDLEVSGFTRGQLDASPPAIYCGWRNWLARLESGLSDASYALNTAPHLMRGVATAGTTLTLTDSGAAWVTNNGGMLSNVDVILVHADGTTETRRVISNTATALTVDSEWSAPVAGEVYYLGAIEAVWRTPRMGLAGWDRQMRVERIRLLSRRPLDDTEAVSVVDAYVQPDEAAVAYVDWPVLGRTTVLAPAGGLCRELRVGVRDFSPDQTFDLAGIGVRIVEVDS